MCDSLRIYLQLIPGFLMSVIILGSMVTRATPTDWVVLPFALSLSLGGILAIARKPVCNWFLFFGSLGVLAAGTFFHYVRIDFILRNGGMEGPRGYGSPVAFLLGWLMTTVVLFVPGVVFSIWNGREIIRHRRLG